MAVSTLELIINIQAEDRKGLLTAFDSRGTRGFPLSIRHEAPTVTLRCVQPGTARPWDDVDLEAARAAGGVRLGLGEFDKAPDSGDWPLAFDGDATGLTALDAAITADALKTALNANPAIATAGGIATVALSGRTYRCVFTTTGAKADFTSGDNNLLPLSTVTIARVVTGTSTRHEVVTITVKRNAYAFQDVWTASPAADVAVSTSIPGGVGASEVQVITLTPGTYGGTYSVQLALPIAATVAIVANTAANPTVVEATAHGLADGDLITIAANNGSTPSLVGTHAVTVIDADHFSIPLNVSVGGTGGSFSKNTIGARTLPGSASADEILAILLTHPEAMRDGLAGIAVTGQIGGPFSVSFQHHLANLDLAAMVATNINLLAPKFVTAEFDLNNDAMVAAFDAAGTNSLTLTAELELEFPGQRPSKPYQDAATIRKDVIDLQTTRPAPVSSYPLPAAIELIAHKGVADGYAPLGGDGKVPAEFLPSAGLVWQVKSAHFTALAGVGYQIDTTGGAVTATLPAAASPGDQIPIEDARMNWGANAVTLARNGLKINGGTTDYTANVSGAKLNCTYISAGYGWSIK